MKGFIHPKRLIVKGFQKCVTFNFPYVDSDLWYWYIISWVKAKKQDDEFEKHPLHYVSFLGVGIFFFFFSFIFFYQNDLHVLLTKQFYKINYEIKK